MLAHKTQGFFVGDKEFGPKYAAEHREKVGKRLASGELITKETITEGVENAPQGLVDIFHGKNFGKGKRMHLPQRTSYCQLSQRFSSWFTTSRQDMTVLGVSSFAHRYI